MGDTFMNFFPADPGLPKPEWHKLRDLLLRRGFVEPPKQGAGVVYEASNLWHDVRHDRQMSDDHRQDVTDLAQLVAALKDTAVIPRDFRLEHGSTVAELAALLRQGGFVSAGFAPSFKEEFVAGPAFSRFCDVSDDDPPYSITYEDHGNRIGVYVGPESLSAPPGIPETDRAVEEWMEFLDRWAKNPNEKWIDPETGRGYGILDLEWENTLGAGRCTLEVLQPGYLNPLKTTELLRDLTGIPFKFCWYHI
jgi:hypothetical protein